MDAHTGTPLTTLYSHDPPSPPAAAAAAAPSKLPNAARPKKGKTSAKKNKAVDGSGSSKARGKKLAGRSTGAAATESPASSLVEPSADAHHVFDEMPQSLNDDAYMSTMGVGSNNSHWSQTNDIHFEDHEFEVEEEGEGIVDAPKGRAGNYTTNDDKLLCNTWLQVSSDPSVGAIVKARKEADKVRKMARNQDAAAEERRLAAEERRVAAEERKVGLEERKVGMEERAKLLEWEKNLFFLDTSLFNDAQKNMSTLPVKKS
ncbi:putative receptor protein kinase ZmPK1 [Hordeum vulgare]|nr:putative receptor protein kinase ZmPK1 [Hordeum vulgare]